MSAINTPIPRCSRCKGTGQIQNPSVVGVHFLIPCPDCQEEKNTGPRCSLLTPWQAPAEQETNTAYLRKVLEIQLAECAVREREVHRPRPSPAYHPETPTLRPQEAMPSSLPPEDQPTPDEPAVFPTPDLTADLAQLRREKETYVLAVKSLQATLTDARRLTAGIDHHQAQAAELLLKEALTSVGALLLLLQDGGAQ